MSTLTETSLPSSEDVLDLMVPAYSGRLLGSQYDWNYTTVGESGLNGRVQSVARGYALGGSSAISELSSSTALPYT